MSNLLNAFLVLVMVVSVWPSLVYVVGQFMNPPRTSSSLQTVRLRIVGTKQFPHPADPPVCMAKLIMLRHRMQQASTRRSQQHWAAPVPKANGFGNPRYRSTSGWVSTTTMGRRWGNSR